MVWLNFVPQQILDLTLEDTDAEVLPDRRRVRVVMEVEIATAAASPFAGLMAVLCEQCRIWQELHRAGDPSDRRWFPANPVDWDEDSA